MRKLNQFLILVAFLSILSMPLMAGDDVPPSEEGVCDGLKTEAGITKGLYGLCVAYCEADAQSGEVLENYNIRKAVNDPPMPCLQVECPCWLDATLTDLNNMLCTGELGVYSDTEDQGTRILALSGDQQVFLLLDSPNRDCAAFAGGIQIGLELDLSDGEVTSCAAGLDILAGVPQCTEP